LKYFAVNTTTGREIDVALVIENRIREAQSIGRETSVTAIIIPPSIRGYVILETYSQSHVYPLISEVKYVKNRPLLNIPLEDVERLIKPPRLIDTLREGEVVEIVRGPFKDMKATIISVNKDKNTLIVKLLDALHEFHVEIPGDYVKPLKRE